MQAAPLKVAAPVPQPKLTVASKPAGVQQSLKVAPVNQQPTMASPPKQPQMDKIASDIGVARSRGADDTTILYRLVEKNPALTEPVKIAIKDRKATPTQVLDQIVSKYTPQPEPEKPGQLDDKGLWNVKGFLKPAKDVAVGVAKSFAKTGATLLKPVDKALEKIGVESGKGLSDEDLKAEGFFQKAGKVTGDILQADAGTRAIAPVATAITKTSQAVKAPAIVQKAIDVVGRSALDAAAGAGITKAQGGSNEDAKTAALIGGSLPWISAAFSTVAKAIGAKKAGEKIQYALIKPSKKDVDSGFKIENVNKYDLGGSLKQTAEKTQSAIVERARKLKSLIKPGSADVDLNKVYYEIVEKLKGVKLENAGSNLALKRELDKFGEELSILSKNGVIDIADAQEIKRAFGAKGAWQFGIPAEDANAIEQVYNTAYNILKTDIEAAATKAGNTGIREINKELSELIPIEQALIRRLPVASRNNPLSLTDLVSLIGGAKMGIPLFFLNRLTKSGKVGAKLATVGKRPQSRGAVSTLISGPGEKQLAASGTVGEVAERIPNVSVGLSIKGDAPKIAELGEKINELETQWVKNPTPANKKALQNARALYKRLTNK